jgi:hypothetical protein
MIGVQFHRCHLLSDVKVSGSLTSTFGHFLILYCAQVFEGVKFLFFYYLFFFFKSSHHHNQVVLVRRTHENLSLDRSLPSWSVNEILS